MIYSKKTDCILNPAEPPTFANKNGQLEEQRLLLLNAVCTIQPPQLSLTGAFYIQSSMLIWNIKDWRSYYQAVFTHCGNNNVHGTTIRFSVDGNITVNHSVMNYTLG